MRYSKRESRSSNSSSFHIFSSAAARSDQQTSIYSPPFYTSPTGYKLCLRLCLDGDGNARRTHLSLFIVLMRGEHDSLLKFPFDGKVIFCLFDQTKQQKHIIDAFRPDARSNSFQRPRSDMNVASGLPKFAELTLFQAENNPYIRDRTMYIKAIVNFGDNLKAMLPDIFSLNSAVARATQQSSNSVATNNEINELSNGNPSQNTSVLILKLSLRRKTSEQTILIDRLYKLYLRHFFIGFK